MMSDAQRRLIRLLELAASYNDKGIHWRRDTSVQVEQTRRAWQGEVDDLVAEIGAAILPGELLAAIRSGVAIHDGSGRYVELAQRWISGDAALISQAQAG